jgi:hypothetical protein
MRLIDGTIPGIRAANPNTKIYLLEEAWEATKNVEVYLKSVGIENAELALYYMVTRDIVTRARWTGHSTRIATSYAARIVNVVSVYWKVMKNSLVYP